MLAACSYLQIYNIFNTIHRNIDAAHGSQINYKVNIFYDIFYYVWMVYV